MSNTIKASSTKPEILAALAEATEEQNVLHKEVVTLNEKIESLETLAKEDGVKKQGLIKQIADQASDVELAKKKTEKYNEIKETLTSTKKELEAVKAELFAANKKVELLTTELAGLKNRALPPKKQRKFFRNFLKTAAVCSVIAFVVVSMVALNVDKDIDELTFITYDNGITAASYDPDILTIKVKDDVELTGADVSIAKWAKEAGYTGIIYGEVMKNDNEQIVFTGSMFEYHTVNIDELVSKLDELQCYNVLALVNNPENIVLPPPFHVSQGELKFYEGRRKLAGIVPVFWGKDKRVINISSDNITGFISSTGIFMDDGIHKTSVSFNVVEETEVEEVVEAEEDSSEVVNAEVSKFTEWKEKVINLW